MPGFANTLLLHPKILIRTQISLKVYTNALQNRDMERQEILTMLIHLSLSLLQIAPIRKFGYIPMAMIIITIPLILSSLQIGIHFLQEQSNLASYSPVQQTLILSLGQSLNLRCSI